MEYGREVERCLIKVEFRVDEDEVGLDFGFAAKFLEEPAEQLLVSFKLQ